MGVSLHDLTKQVCEMGNWKTTNLKLHKILYILNMFYIGRYDKPLINENFEAWDYGPVIPTLFHELRFFGIKPIENIFFGANKLVDDVDEFVAEIYGHLKHKTASELCAITHCDKGAWSKNYNHLVAMDIPIEDVKKEYEEIYRSAILLRLAKSCKLN